MIEIAAGVAAFFGIIIIVVGYYLVMGFIEKITGKKMRK